MLRCTLLFAGLVCAASLNATPEIRVPFSALDIKKPGAACSSIVQLADGAFLTIDGNATVVSRDQGARWNERHPIVADLSADAKRADGVPGGVVMLVRTSDNVLTAVWRDERALDWDNKTAELGKNAKGDVWSIRSIDGGRTWIDRQKIFSGICGHPPVNLLQLRSGRLVVPIQYYVRDPGRNVIKTCVSDDAGHTWRSGNTIDLGGRGHHDGAFEPSLVELRDGRVWMVIRTNWDRYWDAFSDDGLNWRTIRPGAIEASSSPPYITRLASGRLILFWNRLYPEGQHSYERRGEPYSEVAGSWHREELSVALSDDEGTTWTAPRIVAREEKKWLSYSYVFEPKPGLIWLFSGQGKFSAQVHEADLIPTK